MVISLNLSRNNGLTLPARRVSGLEKGQVSESPVLFGGAKLTRAETAALTWLDRLRPAQPEPVIYFTDPGKDPDDSLTCIAGVGLERAGQISLAAAVTTLGDKATRNLRARLFQGMLRMLGNKAPVASGGEYVYSTRERQLDDQLFFDSGRSLAVAPRNIQKNAEALLLKQFQQAKKNKQRLSLVVIAGMTDLARFIEAHPQLFAETTRQVVMMGGVQPNMETVYQENGVTPKVDAHGRPLKRATTTESGETVYYHDQDLHLVPDERAFNNTTDYQAACTVFKAAQSFGVPMTVLSKEAAYTAAVDYRFYRNLSETGHPLGKHLSDTQLLSLERLWSKVKLAVEPALTRSWFIKTFTHIDPVHQAEAFLKLSGDDVDFDEIWLQTRKLNLYDPMALLATLPALKSALYLPQQLSLPAKGKVELIGKKGIQHPGQIKTLLSALAKQTLLTSP